MLHLISFWNLVDIFSKKFWFWWKSVIIIKKTPTHSGLKKNYNQQFGLLPALMMISFVVPTRSPPNKAEWLASPRYLFQWPALVSNFSLSFAVWHQCSTHSHVCAHRHACTCPERKENPMHLDKFLKQARYLSCCLPESQPPFSFSACCFLTLPQQISVLTALWQTAC